MKKLVKVLAWAVIALYVLSFVGVNITRINKPGEAIAVTDAGYVRPHSYQEGIVWIFPLGISQVSVFDKKEQAYKFTFKTRTSELQKVSINGAFRFNVNGDSVHVMLQKVGKEYEPVLIAPLIEGTMNQLVGKQSIEYIAYNQEEVTEAIRYVMANELAPSNLIKVHDVQLFCPDFDQDVEKAIVAKTVAQQETERVKEEAKQMLLLAESEGKALKLKADALSNDLIIKYEVAKALGKWQGNLPGTLILGQDAMPILGTVTGK